MAFINHLRRYFAFGTIGFEYTVFNRTHSGFLDLPCSIGRNVYLITNGIGTENAEFNLAAGCIVVICRVDRCHSELAVGRSCGNNEEGICGRSFTTVRQRAVNLQLFTGTFRYEGSRTATIAVCSINTTHFEHIFAHFVHIETCRIRRLTSIRNGKDDLTFCSDTDEGTRLSTARMVLGVCNLRNTILIGFDKPAPNADRVLFPTGQRIGL